MATIAACRPLVPRAHLSIPATGEQYSSDAARHNTALFLSKIVASRRGTVRDYGTFFKSEAGPEMSLEVYCCGRFFDPNDAGALESGVYSQACARWIEDRWGRAVEEPSLFLELLRENLPAEGKVSVVEVRDRAGEEPRYVARVADLHDREVMIVTHPGRVDLTDINFLEVVSIKGKGLRQFLKDSMATHDVRCAGLSKSTED